MRGIKEWIEVDLKRMHSITAVQTQGRFGNGKISIHFFSDIKLMNCHVTSSWAILAMDWQQNKRKMLHAIFRPTAGLSPLLAIELLTFFAMRCTEARHSTKMLSHQICAKLSKNLADPTKTWLFDCKRNWTHFDNHLRNAGQGQEYAEEYKIEYWRPGMERWVKYRDRTGSEVRSPPVFT